MRPSLAFAVAVPLALFFASVVLDFRIGPFAATLKGGAACARGLTAVRTASRLDTRQGGTESETAVGAALFVATLGRFSRPVPGRCKSVI
jgi:hypothetical protein